MTMMGSGKQVPHKAGGSSATLQYRHFFIVLFFVLISSTVSVMVYLSLATDKGERFERVSLANVRQLPEQVVGRDGPVGRARDPGCTYWDCFNVYRCGHDSMSVYVYPPKRYVDEDGIPATDVMSKEFYEILRTVIESEYYTPDPAKACFFVPSIDTLNEARLRPNLTSRALSSLPYWNDGENHLLFSMMAGHSPDYSPVPQLRTGRALIAGAGLSSATYRPGFDVSLPAWSAGAAASVISGAGTRERGAGDGRSVRPWLLVSAQTNLMPRAASAMRQLAGSHRGSLLVVSGCDRGALRNDSVRCEVGDGTRHLYPDVLRRATFCLVARGVRLAQTALLDAMAAGCVPVVSADGLVMPFADVLDWKLAAVFVAESDLGSVLDRLKAVSDERVAEMQQRVAGWHRRYFGSVRSIVRTTLAVLEQRLFPRRGYEHWNDVPPRSPLFLPVTAPRSHGFTAVILTYDRLDSLFLLVEKLARVPSAVKVLVVWNNQQKAPPPQAAWPRIGKPLSVTRTAANKLSNRFRPYEDIETEAILTIDDDIVMLTADELEFGYEVWREFPDRIVGFPSRTHVWDNVTAGWRYESEWTNEISMVLTGAAFHHKYWNHMYTTRLPADVRDWVDRHMNCEDIAMNFLVANITNKPPIKVAPRKKFKCPECTNNEMLSADLGHMIERSQCVDRFAKAFGRMPLRSVEFRADPVLYKDPFPEKLKRFNEIGSL